MFVTQKATRVFEHLVAENPPNASYRRDLAHSYNTLGRLQTQGADSTIALRSFQRAIDLFESLHELNANDSYNLACNIALCIPLITEKPHLKAPRKSQARATAYAVNSMETGQSNRYARSREVSLIHRFSRTTPTWTHFDLVPTSRHC